ncbi:F-box protein CPR1 [Linum perenne]
MSDNIPTDILTNILERITDVRDLVRWRRVSKRWLSIIDNPDFIQRHLHRSSKYPLTTRSKLGLFVQTSGSCVLYRPENTRRILYPGSVNLIGTCDGLICFQHNSEPKPQILNPSTGERRYFNTFSSRQNGSDPLFNKYGFGYDELSDDYKLVVIRGGKVEFHCVRARKCRTIEFQFCNLIPEPKGVLAYGALHWIGRGHVLYAVDLGSETVRKMQWTPDVNCGCGLYSVGVVLSEYLFLLRVTNGHRVQVWLMKEYWNKDSMVKCNEIEFGREIWSVNLVGYSWIDGRGRNLFLLNGKELVWFQASGNIVEDKAVEVISNVARENGFILDAFYCLDTLVKICPDRRRIFD